MATYSCMIWNLNRPPTPLEALQGILEEAGNGHRPYASGNRRDGKTALADFNEIHVADEMDFFICLDTVDSDVDDDGILLDHLLGNQPRRSRCSHKDVRGPADALKIACRAISDGDGRVGTGLGEEKRQRLADGDAAADDDGMGALWTDTVAGQKGLDPKGRAGNEA